MSGELQQDTLEATERTATEHVETVTARVAQLGGEGFFLDTFGLGIEELSQHVEYRTFKGPLLDAVVDAVVDKEEGGKPCPVGDDIKGAYAKNGLEGVEKKLSTLGDLAETRYEDGKEVKNFEVIIGKTAKIHEKQKKK